MNDRQIQLEVVSDEEGFLKLKPEWDALWLKARGRYFQRFDLCRVAWLHVAKPRARTLYCIVLRESGELRLVWPLVAHRRVLWNYLLPLSPDAGDYTSVLVEDGPNAAALIERAWRAACKHCKADFVHLPYMNEGSELHRIALREPHVLGLSQHEAWVARFGDERDWPAFRTSLGTMYGKKPGQLERRLAKEGALRMHMMDPADKAGIAQCVRDMLSWKRHWSDRVNKKGQWLSSTHYENFLIATLTDVSGDPNARPLARINVVTLDGAPIAAVIMSHGNPVANAVIGGFDPELGKFGAGSIAWEHGVKWAFEQGFDIDFGVGSERFKDYWSRGNCGHAWTMQIANTMWGLVGYRIVRGARDAVDFIKGIGRRSKDDLAQATNAVERHGGKGA